MLWYRIDHDDVCAVHRLVLSPQLAAELRLRPVGEYQLGWVAGVMGPPPEVALLLKLALLLHLVVHQ